MSTHKKLSHISCKKISRKLWGWAGMEKWAYARTISAEMYDNCGIFLDCERLFIVFSKRIFPYILSYPFKHLKIAYVLAINDNFHNNFSCFAKFRYVFLRKSWLLTKRVRGRIWTFSMSALKLLKDYSRLLQDFKTTYKSYSANLLQSQFKDNFKDHFKAT